MKISILQRVILVIMALVVFGFLIGADTSFRKFNGFPIGGWPLELYKIFGLLFGGALLFFASASSGVKK